MKPLVIVTGPDKWFPIAWWATRLCLFIAGLRSHRVTPSHPELPAETRGVVIGGGTDISPEHYGLIGDAGASYDRARDELEIAVLRHAFHRQLPVLGICRGAQLINIVRGGNLYQDLRPHRRHTANKHSVRAIKSVAISCRSMLSQIFRSSPIRVNSLHNQAIKETGSCLQAVAWDRDGFVQAVESTTGHFVIGVQWHPEYLFYRKVHLQLFKAFAARISDKGFSVV